MTDLLVPCDGGPVGSVGWLRVDDPPPVEIRAGRGVFVLDDSDDGFRYVFVNT